ncbi:M23 family metallopeptidase [Adhaeribacter radiodurans]|uniref:M23 family metallopeptidase n=1 Tax=Adhaeribacter radiodurans TaxID=2745197 RepID=A0A7L7L196_9BACT|nr:M23 family metallopeptidase [Adhaeribacter radiodurans]QMU26557.1 M23 family metallopeptidase [Adhaeribacter radiodurans]
MRILKQLSPILLLIIPYTAKAQFNTIKKVEILPQIQIDYITSLSNNPEDNSIWEAVNVNNLRQKANVSVSMPLQAPIISSGFGNRIDPLTGKIKFHYGLDFRGSSDSIKAILPGTIKKVAYSRGLGNYVEVEHGEFKTIYGHLSQILVREKIEIIAGTVLGITGSTGRSTGEHLHFAIKHRGKAINPVPFLNLVYRRVEMEARKKSKRMASELTSK